MRANRRTNWLLVQLHVNLMHGWLLTFRIYNSYRREQHFIYYKYHNMKQYGCEGVNKTFRYYSCQSGDGVRPFVLLVFQFLSHGESVLLPYLNSSTISWISMKLSDILLSQIDYVRLLFCSWIISSFIRYKFIETVTVIQDCITAEGFICIFLNLSRAPISWKYYRVVFYWWYILPVWFLLIITILEVLRALIQMYVHQKFGQFACQVCKEVCSSITINI